MTPSRPLSPQIAGPRHALHFSNPAGLGVIAVTVTAVIALGLLLLPPGDTPPIAVVSPSATSTATAEPETPSPEPSPTLTPDPTHLPTPQLTPEPIAEWTGLVWSDPVTPPFYVYLNDLLPWGEGYVAVGTVYLADASEAAFLTSPDGLHWTVRHREDLGGEREPERLASFGDELFAFSRNDVDHPVGGMVISAPPLIWRSDDGATWTQVDSPTWSSVWNDGLLVDVDSGPDGIIAVGNHLTGEYNQASIDPIVLRSTDGMGWTHGQIIGGTNHSVVTDVVPFAGGFALLGGDETSTVPGEGLPRAWFSDDGLTWLAAPVEGATDSDNHFWSDRWGARAGSDGIVTRTQLLCAGCWGGPSLDWISTDGLSWHRATDLGVQVRGGWMAGDGTHIVSFGSGEWEVPAHPGGDVDVDEASFSFTHAWTTSDGVTWTELTLSHPMTDQIWQFWVVPDGVIYAGDQSFWFGTATER